MPIRQFAGDEARPVRAEPHTLRDEEVRVGGAPPGLPDSFCRVDARWSLAPPRLRWTSRRSQSRGGYPGIKHAAKKGNYENRTHHTHAGASFIGITLDGC